MKFLTNKAIQIPLILVILTVVGCTARGRANHFNENAMDEKSQPDQILKDLRLEPGMHIADLGAGGGYYTFRFSSSVGPTGKVYAVDVDKEFLEFIAQKSREQGITNVVPVQARAGSSGLSNGSADLIFIRNVYHHLPEPRANYFKRLAPALKDKGRIAIIDFRDEDFSWASLFGHATPTAEIKADLAAAGYELKEEHSYLPEQSFLIFIRTRAAN